MRRLTTCVPIWRRNAFSSFERGCIRGLLCCMISQRRRNCDGELALASSINQRIIEPPPIAIVSSKYYGLPFKVTNCFASVLGALFPESPDCFRTYPELLIYWPSGSRPRRAPPPRLSPSVSPHIPRSPTAIYSHHRETGRAQRPHCVPGLF